jgi:universal stress protein A
MSANIRSILAPTDFSPSSERAVEYAAALAAAVGASVHLIHILESLISVVKPWEALATETAAHHERLYLEGRSKLAALAARVERLGSHATSEVRSGTPATEIVKAAVDYGADLIVMATHGRSGLPHLLLGSVAEEVMRQAPCPVLTVRGTRTQGTFVAGHGSRTPEAAQFVER